MSASVANMEKAEGDPDVILPMIAEVDLNIAVHGKNCTVTLRAPGTISGELCFFVSLIDYFRSKSSFSVFLFLHR